MSGDNTRFTFDPRKRYAAVRMQQGRVSLDSDWNEASDIARHHLRTQALDAFGPVGVAPSTPDAFKVGPLPGADLSIGPGRLYVDGLPAEIFPDEIATYLNQPFLPNPPPLPVGDALIYLDVWQAEVTFAEDPGLLDVALGGADTATRLRTVWQVRAEARERAACGMPVGDPPSAGRLTTRAIAPPAADDPCILPPVIGYRGLENRLYRVQIHTPGPLGTASFKWSRDNGSVISAAVDLAVGAEATTVTVQTVGRDPVLRLRIGDWVTVTDDHRELDGIPGAMACITGIDPATRQLVLDRALPLAGVGAFGSTPAEVAARHTRVQRWDQSAASNALDADGLIATGAGPIPIEDGIQVSLSADPAGGSFRAGDYWTFAARVADASVEVLTNAPPAGVGHRYAALAVVSSGGVEDCRPKPPAAEDCCTCTVTVAPGSDLATLPGRLPANRLVHICLPAGVFLLRDAVVLDGRTDDGTGRGELLLTGCGPATRIVATAEAAFLIRHWRSVRVRDLAVETRPGEGRRRDGIGILGGVTVLNSAEVAIEGVEASCAGGAGTASACLRIAGANPGANLGANFGDDGAARSVRVRGCTMNVGPAATGLLITDAQRSEVVDNEVRWNPAVAIGSEPGRPRTASRGIGKLVGRSLTAAAVALPPPAGLATATVRFNGLLTSFHTPASLASSWQATLDAAPPANPPRTEAGLVRELRRRARQVVAARGEIAGAPEFRRWYDDATSSVPSAAAGIVIAGRAASDVRVAENGIAGVGHGIRVALSHGGPRLERDVIGRVTVAENRVDVVSGGAAEPAVGILVGNAGIVAVRGNALACGGSARGRRTGEGVRIFGAIGRMVTARDNHMVGFGTGVRLVPLGAAKQPLWLIEGNLAEGAVQVLAVPPAALTAHNHA